MLTDKREKAAILRSVNLPYMHPMRVERRLEPFDHPDWIYEITFDGFRARAYIEDGKQFRHARFDTGKVNSGMHDSQNVRFPLFFDS